MTLGSRAYYGAPAEGPRVRIARRVLDLERRVLIDPADGNEERLTASEFDLLKIFAENPNRPLMRDWLLEVTAHREADAFDRAIDLRITRQRRRVSAARGARDQHSSLETTARPLAPHPRHLIALSSKGDRRGTASRDLVARIGR